MPQTATTQEFVAAWERHGGKAAAIADDLGMLVRSVYMRRQRLEARGWELPALASSPGDITHRGAYPLRQHVQIFDGVMVVFGDAHWWPGDPLSPAEAALLTLLHRLDPDYLVANGDVYDGASNSRHPPIGWERKPTVAEELGELQQRMRRISDHAKRAVKMRTVGNHDRRFDYKLAAAAGEYAGVAGTRLADHLPDWPESWSIHVNEGVVGGHTVIKHKLRQGVTAGRNNAMHAGVHIVTNHTHALDCTPVEDYSGRRYAVQCGAIVDTRGPQVEYGEDAPNAGRAGFAVLTWTAGVLQPPELCEVDDAGVPWFRGDPVALKPRVRVKAGRG
jgi:hypothetical protein